MGILGFILLALLVLFGLKDNLAAFIDAPSLLIILFPTLGALLLSYGSGVVRAVRAAWGEAGAGELAFAIGVWERAVIYALASGSIGTLVGMVAILAGLDDPKQLGSAYALALITLVYALGLAFGVFAPIAASLRRRATHTAAG